MSENIPESIPTSADPRSHRPLKRRALSPTSKQAAHLTNLFAHPDKPIALPPSFSSSDNALTKHTSLAPPEIVSNVQGSSAGAGSGEFHVYKASRRREYERLRAMDEEKEKEEGDAEFEREAEERRRADEEKTAKNRAKREKARLRQSKKKGGAGAGVDGGAKGGEKMEGVQRVKFKANVDTNENGTTGAVEQDGGDGMVDNPDEVGIIIHDED